MNSWFTLQKYLVLIEIKPNYRGSHQTTLPSTTKQVQGALRHNKECWKWFIFLTRRVRHKIHSSCLTVILIPEEYRYHTTCNMNEYNLTAVSVQYKGRTQAYWRRHPCHGIEDKNEKSIDPVSSSPTQVEVQSSPMKISNLVYSTPQPRYNLLLPGKSVWLGPNSYRLLEVGVGGHSDLEGKRERMELNPGPI